MSASGTVQRQGQPPLWWEDPTWRTTSWTCPRCGTEMSGTPAVGIPCPLCGYREAGD